MIGVSNVTKMAANTTDYVSAWRWSCQEMSAAIKNRQSQYWNILERSSLWSHALEDRDMKGETKSGLFRGTWKVHKSLDKYSGDWRLVWRSAWQGLSHWVRNSDNNMEVPKNMLKVLVSLRCGKPSKNPCCRLPYSLITSEWCGVWKGRSLMFAFLISLIWSIV